MLDRTNADNLIPEEQRKSIFELTDATCRWPVGDPCEPGFFFCGAEISVGSGPYCPDHASHAFVGKRR